MSETAFDRMTPARRGALLSAAAAEFASRPFTEASLNRIIGACRMSKSSFYHVIDSKEELFDRVVADLLARADWTPPSPEAFADDFWDRARTTWAEVMAAAASSEPLTLLWHIVYLSPDRPSVLAFNRDVDAWTTRVLETGRSTGALDITCTAEFQARALLSLLRSFDEWALAADRTDAEPAEQLFRLIVRLLQARGREPLDS